MPRVSRRVLAFWAPRPLIDLAPGPHHLTDDDCHEPALLSPARGCHASSPMRPPLGVQTPPQGATPLAAPFICLQLEPSSRDFGRRGGSQAAVALILLLGPTLRDPLDSDVRVGLVPAQRPRSHPGVNLPSFRHYTRPRVLTDKNELSHSCKVPLGLTQDRPTHCTNVV